MGIHAKQILYVAAAALPPELPPADRHSDLFAGEAGEVLGR